MAYEACLFDMDGVIIDTRRAVTTFWAGVAQHHGVTLSRADFEERIYGCPGVQTLDTLFSHLGPAERDAVLASMLEYETAQPYVALPGVLDFVRALAGRGIPTALVTSGDRAKVRSVASQIALEGLFGTTVTVEDVQRGKPAPDAYRLAAARLGVQAERCIVFEDSRSGVQAAVAAGAACVGVGPEAAKAALLARGATGVIPDFTPGSIRIAESDDASSPGLPLAGGAWLILPAQSQPAGEESGVGSGTAPRSRGGTG